MKESRDYLEMSFRSIQCFASDGSLDVKELSKVIDIAERDGNIDKNEIRVIKSIVSRLKPEEMDEEVTKKLNAIIEKFDSK